MINEYIPLEDEECLSLVDYLNIMQGQGKVVLYTHIPNETYTKSWSVKVKNKKKGVHKGFPDYVVVTPTTTYFIEMKRIKGGTIGEEQKQWIEALKQTGLQAKVCRGFDEAKAFLNL